ncbi:putative acetyltransferase [Cytobacillus horneckiae]|uniref:GNAT family N-acetyltransferase n=1 Tax=Cytobacillus horneckiae TaxID=549687 RepID=A0A2N0ZGN9_9BACI|nr:GNAT family N-acetyltransferase [Cytobacillus horneckiae]MBN6886516.1 GNAT family N-acetyltransferase [Cytobacillus horneckiae]MCM3176754.1 GNAT family N-acetyltransferase [Cytobacillus horneckiae]MEC1157653.1 GNAT family N-acetyltransferase [Cytobacillus horneckiae]MED2939678.1 GNAT family N-acetyltransferase [Cytobacillus horneckiae]PKG28672.1 GNAT family N-acetyltransferase [Cytobacillus horneckiae]
MKISLKEVAESEKTTLQNLYALYLHDLSKYTDNIDIDENGLFQYEDIHLFWTTEGIAPYFIMLNGRIAGFLLLLERPFLTKENDFGINDIFILNKYKGKGLGFKAIELLFENKKGQYFVMEMVSNIRAVSFWRKVFKELNINYNERQQQIDNESCVIQTFTV